MKPYRWIGWLWLLGCLLLPAVAQAQDQMPIRLLAATFDPVTAGEPVFAAAAGQAAGQQAPPSPYSLVQFTGPVEPAWLQQVAALGGEVLGYVPENTHVVRAAAAALAKIRSLPTVRWTGTYQPGYKLAPALSAQLAVLAADASATPVKVVVVSFPGESLDDLHTFLQALGVTIRSSAATRLGGIFEIDAPLTALPTLIQYPGVSWVEPYVPMYLANAEGRKIMGAESIWQESGYFGADQIIAISDSGLSVQGGLSPDFDGRLIRGFAPSEMNVAANCRAKTTFTDINGHGTHVAGSVLSSGARSGSNPASHQYTGSHAGVAPEARMVFMALNTDGSTGIQCIDQNGDFIAKGYQLGARISTNSWGANDRGGYNVISAIVDDYIWQHKDYLVLYAAGNAGRNGASTVGSPGTAKNILTVGASENNRVNPGGQEADDPDTVTVFSSRGPTQDGRIKPDVVAPGSWVLSSRAPQIVDPNIFDGPFNDDYAFMSGTSMATPLTAGAAALVREWLGKERNLPNPSAALLKGVMINGATQLPGLATINNDSGRGRVDLKNTLRGHYAVLDDHVQGLTTGQFVTYSVRIVATTTVGSFVTTNLLPSTLVQAARADGVTLEPGVAPLVASVVVTDATALQAQGLPGHAAGRTTQAIPSGGSKAKRPALVNPVPNLSQSIRQTTGAGFQPGTAGQPAETTGYWYNMIGGGDFEDPAWSDFWQDVWLGLGVPERTDDPRLVLNGNYSMWLGGTEFEDSIWYPLHFPDSFDNQNDNVLAFNLGIFDEDLGNDLFCVALVDTSGYFIGPYAPDQPECAQGNGLFTYKKTFTTAELADLAGQTGYLVLYTQSDGLEPHMSAIVDEIGLSIDIPAIELAVNPSAGPPGTTFLLTGKYHIPYSAVKICIQPCSNTDNYIKSIYADAQGNIAAFLYTSARTTPGVYTIETEDCECRQGQVQLTVGDEPTSTLSVDPESGRPGTKFNFTGSGFQPNDNQIQATLGDEALGTVSSNAQGAVAFALTTSPSIPVGMYTLQLVDSSGHSASASFTIVAGEASDPTLAVDPTSGPPGTTFTFTAQNFTAGQPADVLLGGQKVGQLTPNEAGGATFTFQTKTDIAPGKYTVTLRQGEQQASAEFTVTAGGGGENPQSGNGLYVTLTWTDPPVRSGSAVVLVNDLDLSINGPNGQVFGNGGSSPNRIDNVESIRLENPPVGEYVITVRAERVNGAFGAQPYALVATTKQSYEANATNLGVQVGGGSGFQIYLPNVAR